MKDLSRIASTLAKIPLVTCLVFRQQHTHPAQKTCQTEPPLRQRGRKAADSARRCGAAGAAVLLAAGVLAGAVEKNEWRLSCFRLLLRCENATYIALQQQQQQQQ